MSKWITYDYQFKSDFEARPGVYVIFLDGKLFYIGSSINCQKRLDDGHDVGWARYSSSFVTPWGTGMRLVIKIRYTERFGDWAMRETRLIHRLQPAFNKRGTRGLAFGR